MSPFFSMESVFQDPAINTDSYYLPGDEAFAGLQGFGGSLFQSAAAGDLHAHDSKTFDIVLSQNLGQLFSIVYSVQLGTADEGDPSPDEVLMKAGISISAAVRRDQEMRLIKIRGSKRRQFNLHRPLRELALEIA